MLPFTNLSSDPKLEFFSDGISEDLITALSKLRWFFVVARNSSFIYKGKTVHMKQVAAELGWATSSRVASARAATAYVSLSSLMTSAPAVTSGLSVMTANLSTCSRFRTRSQRLLSPLSSRSSMLPKISEPNASRRAVWINGTSGRLLHYWRVTRQDSLLAQALLEKATAIDPNYSQALGALAASHTFSAHMGWADMAATAPIADSFSTLRSPS